jgi:hypothetical protein
MIPADSNHYMLDRPRKKPEAPLWKKTNPNFLDSDILLFKLKKRKARTSIFR